MFIDKLKFKTYLHNYDIVRVLTKCESRKDGIDFENGVRYNTIKHSLIIPEFFSATAVYF